MREFADTILAFLIGRPQLVLMAAMAAVMCVGLYQLIRMNSEIQRITGKIKKYMDAVMAEDAPLPAETAKEAGLAANGRYDQKAAQLTPEETRMLLSEDAPAKAGQKKSDEAIFNEVLQEFF